MKWFFLSFGFALIFMAPSMGEKLQCLAIVHQTHGGPVSPTICERSVWVEMRYVAPFQIFGALLCVLALRRIRLQSTVEET